MKGMLPAAFIRRIGIRNKMLLMYAAVILTMTVVMSGIFLRMNGRYAEMLYQETTDSLFLISNEMKLYLDSIETDSYYMVADSSLQSNLSAYRKAAEGWPKRKLWNQIESSVYNYAVGNRYVRSVTLMTPDFTVCRGSTSLQEPEVYLDQLKQRADEENGKAFWAASRADPSTVLMVRAYREIQNLSLKTMGYQIFRVDISRIAGQLMENYRYLTNEVPLIILDQKTSGILYPAPDQIQADSMTVIGQLPKDGYRIIRDGKEMLFAVAHTVENPQWNYYLLIPYDSVFRSVKSSLLTMFISLLVITAVMFAAAGWFSSGLCRHFSVLQLKMERVSGGNLEPMATDCNYQERGDEIGFLNRCFDQMLLDLRRMTEENDKKQQLLREAQIHSLEQQMNPHFLYNTLDLVYWRAKMGGQEEICMITESLAKLLQSALSRHKEVDSLKRELELCQYYMKIQKMRFDEKLIYQEVYDPALLNAQVPYLCIQPLLENAVKYGVEQTLDSCTVTLKIEIKDSVLIISVENDGSEAPEDLMTLLYRGEKKPQGHGIGLINIDKRTKLLFGAEYGISVESSPDRVRVFLKLPFQRNVLLETRP